MGTDIIRDSPLGQILNRFFGLMPYADQRSDYVVPERYLPKHQQAASSSNEKSQPDGPASPNDAPSEDHKAVPEVKPDADSKAAPATPSTNIDQPVVRQISGRSLARTTSRSSALSEGRFRFRRMPTGDVELTRFCSGYDPELSQLPEGRQGSNGDLEKAGGDVKKPADGARDDVVPAPAGEPTRSDQSTLVDESKYQLVEFLDEDDPERPVNWSFRKRMFVVFTIVLYTFSVYIGSAIYTPGIPGVMEQFGIGSIHATWGLTLYVLGYGWGPMFLAPFQDMARFGRNGVYVWGLLVFILFQLPIVFSNNLPAILFFRWATGFVGSPALATGGATLGDIFAPQYLPYVIGLWSIGAVCGPVFGPVVGGFAAQANGWKWTIYELIWLSSFTFLILIWLFPETLESKVLADRARRLRKLTGNKNLRSQGEIDMEKEPPLEFFKHALWHPFELATEPAVLFANLYIGLAYAILYLWFEAFPITFSEIYGWNLGVAQLPYLGFIVASIITFPAYCAYQKYHIEPRWMKNGGLAPEARLEIGAIAGVFIPVSLLIFGWTSRASVHWIVPIIGASLYLPGIYLLFQSILLYLAMSYPRDAASIFAVNDLFRSTVAAFFPLFGHAYFSSKLGLGGGCTLLAGVSIVMLGFLLLLIKYGPVLRKRSKWAVAD